MDITTIHEAFVRNFIQKDRRERCLLELKRGTFITRLNHDWETVLDMRYVSVLPKDADTYSYLKKELGISNRTVALAISHYQDVHEQVLPLGEAFEKVHGRGLASLLILAEGAMIYVETEQEQGPPIRLIGIRKLSSII